MNNDREYERLIKNNSGSLWVFSGFCLAALFAFIGVVVHVLYGYSIPSSGHAFGSDDAFISYRYAQNLVTGNGLVFNPGEPVEGYSNFLYIILMAPGFLFGREHIYFFSVALNFVLLLACFVLLRRLINRHMGVLSGVIGIILMALSPALWANAATGLESILMLFLVLSMWVCLDADKVPFRLLLCVAAASILCRVDGFILPLIAAGCLFIDGRRGFAYGLFLFVMVAMFFYTEWRLFYYQDYIANTYHAKVTGHLSERIFWGVKILINSTKLNGVALYGLLIYTCVGIGLWRRTTRVHLFPLVYVSSIFLYFIYIGGDIYYERFLLAAIPIGIFFTLLLVTQLRVASALVILPIIVLLAGMLVLVKDDRFAYQVKRYDMWENLGYFFKEMPSGALLAIDAAGKVPYYSGLPTLDMLGLNDRHIGQRNMPEQPFVTAHSKHDADYVLSRKPLLIAAWIFPSLDLAWEMTRNKYKTEYEVKYLVNSLLESKGRDIIDVQGMMTEEIQSLIAENYNYAVLARRNEISQLPQADGPPFLPSLVPGASISYLNNDALLGWHAAEENFRWSNGNRAKIRFKALADATYKGRFSLSFSSLGVQSVSIFLNGHLLGIYQLDGRNYRMDIAFKADQLNREDVNALVFDLPNARTPGNGDPRVLSIALRELTIY